MKSVPAETDYIVVGAGVAGMRAAIELAAAGRVLVLAKNELTESATQYAQGGVAVALSDEDEISLHLQDTLDAGDGLSNPEAARVLVEEGPARIQELIEWGTEFDRQGTKLTFTREAAHSRSRILHAHGDSTGREIGRALYAKATTLKHISFWEWEFTSDLCVRDGRVAGIRVMNEHGEAREVHARAVLLATGGLGQVYRETTNPGVATGDGVAMAFRAGGEVQDMEFVQFHPTALYVKKAPRFLLSEALRGEGAYLRNAEMHRFMPKYHEMAELAPRDVVARAIAHELEVSRLADPVVYLDLTHLNSKHVAARFPRIYSTCLEYNIDIGTDLIPVRPAAHYAMGGVRTDLHGRTSLPGLYAAGEAACTGVHGANRLASNSLLEGVVFGARAGRSMRESGAHAPQSNAIEPPEPLFPCTTEAQIRRLAWRKCGIIRSGDQLDEARKVLEGDRMEPNPNAGLAEFCLRNIHTVVWLIARCALARQESRGAHFRTDFPDKRTAFEKHSVVSKNSDVRFL